MLRVQIMSDLHLDRQLHDGYQVLSKGMKASKGVDVLVLAGDVAELHSKHHEAWFELICRKYPHVIYVPGNHDYWEASLGDTLAKLAGLSAKFPNLHILRRDAVTIGGQRFIGATLWFGDVPAARIRAKSWVDFRRTPASALWIWDESKQDRAYLMTNVQAGDIVVTHHLPLYRSLDPRFLPRDGGMGDNCFYLHDMSELFGTTRSPFLWVHGHTHITQDYMAGDTRVVCNPWGYRGEYTNYRDLIIELPNHGLTLDSQGVDTP